MKTCACVCVYILTDSDYSHLFLIFVHRKHVYVCTYKFCENCSSAMKSKKINELLISLLYQVMNAAWDVCLPVVSENSLPCFDRMSYNRVLERAKPLNDPDGRHFLAFTYLRLNPHLLERHNFMEFERFVKRMHGMVSLSVIDDFCCWLWCCSIQSQ